MQLMVAQTPLQKCGKDPRLLRQNGTGMCCYKNKATPTVTMLSGAEQHPFARSSVVRRHSIAEMVKGMTCERNFPGN